MSEEILDKLAAALCKVQSELRNIPKTKPGVHNSKYADLADIMDAIREPLARNGLSLYHSTSPVNEESIHLTATLLHVSGQSISSTLPIDANLSAQALGSACTYARRYTMMLLGVVTDSDEDGALATAEADRPKPKRQTLARGKPAPKPKPKDNPEPVASTVIVEFYEARCKDLGIDPKTYRGVLTSIREKLAIPPQDESALGQKLEAVLDELGKWNPEPQQESAF